MTLARDILSIVAIVAGAFFFLAGTAGLLRFPDTLSRLHALTKADNLGLGFIVLGVAFQAGSVLSVAGLIAVWLLGILSSATVSQLIAHAVRGRPPGT